MEANRLQQTQQKSSQFVLAVRNYSYTKMSQWTIIKMTT